MKHRCEYPKEFQRGKVRSMRRVAREERMWAEVRASYLAERKSGECPCQAAWCALYEWDIA